MHASGVAYEMGIRATFVDRKGSESGDVDLQVIGEIGRSRNCTLPLSFHSAFRSNVHDDTLSGIGFVQEFPSVF